ncbi:hypothetical protein BLJAPNOD_02344 [Ensifer sp. M14]|uniref:hypothetical protein n=1 Tax=Ensifer sp. M14 TaxID=2203782 RepID=UPI000E2CA841|nr:hypothetical protein [Ensifer sp. M14]RDL51212.1 hypothetical protein BLJAPNOD_02344 [Ensifer sp. M14]
MRDASLQRFLRCLASPATESAAEWTDGAAVRSSRRTRGRCAKADRCLRRRCAPAFVRLLGGALSPQREILAELAPPDRPGAVAARFTRFVLRHLPQGRAERFVGAARAVTVEV